MGNRKLIWSGLNYIFQYSYSYTGSVIVVYVVIFSVSNSTRYGMNLERIKLIISQQISRHADCSARSACMLQFWPCYIRI